MASLCKIDTDDDAYYLCHAPVPDDEGFFLTLTDCSNAWCGTVSEDDLEQMSRKLRVKLEDFLTDTTKALTRTNMGSLNFEYEVKKGKSGEVTFSWKKYVPAENIRIQLGHARMRRAGDTCDVMKRMLDQVMESATRMRETMHTLSCDNERLASERATALKRLDKAVTAKEDMETDLYSKFVIVINDKKRKIRELKNELDDIQNGPSSTSNHSEVKRARVESEEESEPETHDPVKSEPESDYNTDEERDIKPSTSQRSPTKPSRGRGDVSGDADLAFDGAEEISPVVTTTARRRRGKQNIKKTPSKPVIPKVPSSDSKKTPTSTSRPSLRRKSSSKKSNSSDPDFEDLLNAGFD